MPKTSYLFNYIIHEKKLNSIIQIKYVELKYNVG